MSDFWDFEHPSESDLWFESMTPSDFNDEALASDDFADDDAENRLDETDEWRHDRA